MAGQGGFREWQWNGKGEEFFFGLGNSQKKFNSTGCWPIFRHFKILYVFLGGRFLLNRIFMGPMGCFSL